MDVSVKTYRGGHARPFLDAVAELRIEVFREWPYLYEGTPEYEREYLKMYAQCPEAVVVIAFAGQQVVGASTALPMRAAEGEFQQPFRDAGENLSTLFYFGESVLLPDYRGQGLGHRFFDEREAAAAADAKVEVCTFCAVIRPADHPRKPANYRPLDAFWHKRGYRKYPEKIAHLAWKDVGEVQETTKPLTFWRRKIR